MRDRAEIKIQARQNYHAQFGVCILASILLIISNPIALYNSISNIIESLGWYGYLDTLRIGVTANTNFISATLAFIARYSTPEIQLSSIGVLNYFAPIFSLFITPAIWVGICSLHLRIYRGQKGTIGDVFKTGFNDLGRNVCGIFWMSLFIVLWSMLLIIPGIIKMLSYFMTPYILADSEKVRASDALRLSIRMTNGCKGKIFVMALSFIVWELLSVLSFGLIGIFYACPYRGISFAGLYEELKQKAIEEGTVTAEELA